MKHCMDCGGRLFVSKAQSIMQERLGREPILTLNIMRCDKCGNYFIVLYKMLPELKLIHVEKLLLSEGAE